MTNSVILIGRITKDIEIRRTESGKSVCSFSLAVDSYNSQTKSRTASFIPCTAWNNVADNLDKFCKKGSLICVEGKLNQRSYKSKDGKNVSVVEVIVSSVEFLERRNATANDTLALDDTDSLDDTTSLESSDTDLPF